MLRTTSFAAIALTAAALLSACGGSEKKTVTVNLPSSDTKVIHFGYCDSDGDRLSREDTVAVKDGVASLDLARYADSMPLAYFFYTQFGDQVYFLPQNDELAFTEKEIEAGNPDAGYTIEANCKQLSDDNQKLLDLYTLTSKYSRQGHTLNEKYKAAANSNDTVAIDSIREEYNSMVDAMKKEINSFIASNIDNIAGQVALVNNLDQFKFDIAAFDALMATLKEGTLKDKLLKKMEPARKIQPGAQFVEINLPTPEGDSLKLSEIVAQNKVTLLDFWASWCGPCRRFNPLLVEIYKKFHDNGFEIYAVSLDKEKDQWTEAIKSQNLSWRHVSDLNAWDCQARKDYMVDGIPSNVLINQNGEILAHSLDGDELQAKLEELLAK